MEKRLPKLLSVLCVLALVLSCVCMSALAEDKVLQVIWEDGDNYDGLRPDSLDVQLGTSPAYSLTAADSWVACLSDDDPAAAWTVPDLSSAGYARTVSEQDGLTVVKYYHDVETINLTAGVEWEDGDDRYGLRPDSVQLRLQADGVDYGTASPARKANGWSATWEGIPKYRPGTKTEVDYTVKQVTKPAGYNVSESGLVVTNTVQTGELNLDVSEGFVPAGADLSGITVIVDGPDPSMPKEFSFATLAAARGTALGTVQPGAYLIKIKNPEILPDEYTVDYANSKTVDAVYVNDTDFAVLELKLSYKAVVPVATPAPGEPEPDPTANYGSLTFEILGPDGKMPMTVTYANFTNGQYEIGDLIPGVYVVIEKNAGVIVDGYILTNNSNTGIALKVEENGTATASLFNQYKPYPTPEPDAIVVDIPVTKTWVDNGNADGNRPASVIVRLYADGVEVDTHELTAAEGWGYIFKEKPRYTDAGEEIKYTVKEDPVEWYEASVNGTSITNTYHPEVTSLAVSKVWVDENNRYNRRPTSIAVTLSNGTVAVLNEANGWSYTFTNLPVKVNGQPVEYSVREQEVLGYTGRAEQVGNTMVFTNTLWERPELTQDQGNPPRTGDTWFVFEEYETPLGVEVIINHVGDCFD